MTWENISDRLMKHPEKEYAVRALSFIDEIIIHHVGVEGASVENTAKYHVKTKDWPGIGYHFWICPNGTIYQVNPLENISFHCSEMNNNTVGITLDGCFTEGREPTKEQLQSGRTIIDYLDNLLGKELPIQGHKDYVATLCPGDTWEYWRHELIPGEPEPPTNTIEYWKNRAVEEGARNAELQIIRTQMIKLAEEILAKAQQLASL